MLRVVVAEDDDDLRELLCALLEKNGFQVIDLEDGSELLDYFNIAIGASSPDLILADVNMPGMSGLEAVEEARAAGLRCPVIMMTALPDVEMVTRAAKIAQTRLVAKPSNVSELLRMVQAAVDT